MAVRSEIPQEAGPRPVQIPVVSDSDHRRNKRDGDSRDEKPKNVPPSPDGEAAAPAEKPAAVVSQQSGNLKSALKPLTFPRTRSRIYDMLLGTPPQRAMDNKPPFFSIAFYRWLYFWIYVTLRLYKGSKLHWVPVPRAGAFYRARRSVRAIRNVKFYTLKCIASFSKKGGVGKTSLLKGEAGLLKHVRRAWNVLIQDNNPDRGTLADRIKRTTVLCVQDLVDNIKKIEIVTDFTRYCSEMKEGAWLLASTRPDEFLGELDISETQFDEIHGKEEQFFDVVFYDCGTGTKDRTNVKALIKADVIRLISTSARDSIKQTVDTYVWLRKQSELRGKHVILVINRKHWWTNLDRLHRLFTETVNTELNKVAGFDPESMGSFTVLGVGWDKRLALGLNFSALQLRRSVRADLLELQAVSCELMADSHVDSPESQLTHAQVTEANSVSPVEGDGNTDLSEAGAEESLTEH